MRSTAIPRSSLRARQFDHGDCLLCHATWHVGVTFADAGGAAGSSESIPKHSASAWGHPSVSFTMETYMYGDLQADREVAHALRR